MCIIQLQGRIRWHVNKPEMATEAVPPQINRLRIGQPVASVRALLARNRRAPESRLAPTGQKGLGRGGGRHGGRASGWLPTSTGSIPSRVGAAMRPVARGAVDRDGLGRFPLQSLGGAQRADDGTQSGVVASSHDVSPDNGGVAAVDVRRHVAKIVHPHPAKRKPYRHPLSLGVLRVASVWIWCGRWDGSPPPLSVL